MSVRLSNRDYIWSYAGVILSLCGSIIMTPFVLYFLDSDLFGVWGVFQSLAAITTLFDFGFSTTFARNINYCWNGASKLEKTGAQYSDSPNPNFYLMKKAMSACQTVFLILSVSAFVIMISMGMVYIHYIAGDVKEGNAEIAWLIYSVAIFLNLYFGYYGSFLRGVGAISDANKATILSKCAQILLTIILLWMGFGLVGTSIAYLIYGTLYRQIARYSFYHFKNIGKGLKAVKVRIPGIEIKEMFLVVWYNAWREGLVSLSNYLANQACTVICSLYMPLVQTGAYSLAVQVASAVSHISAAMYTANQPVLQSAYINNDNDKMKRTMSLIVVSFVALNFIGIVVAIILGLPVLRLIKPDVVVSASIMLGVGFYQFILKFRNCYTSYFSCTNRIPYVNAFLLSAFVCVGLAFFFLGRLKLGVWGLIMAQIISQGGYNAWIWTIRAHKDMGLTFKETIVYGTREITDILHNFVRRGVKST